MKTFSNKHNKRNNKRFKNYPKGSILLFQMICKNCDVLEKTLINIFKLKFNNKTNIGYEYFEGDLLEMTNIIYSYCVKI